MDGIRGNFNPYVGATNFTGNVAQMSQLMQAKSPASLSSNVLGDKVVGGAYVMGQGTPPSMQSLFQGLSQHFQFNPSAADSGGDKMAGMGMPNMGDAMGVSGIGTPNTELLNGIMGGSQPITAGANNFVGQNTGVGQNGATQKYAGVSKAQATKLLKTKKKELEQLQHKIGMMMKGMSSQDKAKLRAIKQQAGELSEQSKQADGSKQDPNALFIGTVAQTEPFKNNQDLVDLCKQFLQTSLEVHELEHRAGVA